METLVQNKEKIRMDNDIIWQCFINNKTPQPLLLVLCKTIDR